MSKIKNKIEEYCIQNAGVLVITVLASFLLSMGYVGLYLITSPGYAYLLGIFTVCTVWGVTFKFKKGV